jgi:poly(glycerol-phosphate) alpha-glucosyltransferase
VSPRGTLDPWALANSAWKKRLAGWLYENRHLRGAACLHALCEAEAAAIRAHGLHNPVCVIPNGVDLPGSTTGPRPGWEGDRVLGRHVLLYLGRLHPKKNLISLLEAWAAAQRSASGGREWRLVVAGWDQGGYEERLRWAATELEVEESVHFAGPQFGEEKHATLCRADAFILPSLSEGLPVAVLEAWAYGLPVVMTPECNLTEGFQASAAIRIGTDAESLARGLAELFEMGESQLREMGKRGRRLVEERFSWPKIARQMKEVYEWVLGGGPRPECVRTD